METREMVEQQQYLTFFLAGEEYAITILKVKEIIEYHTVTTVPKTPNWVRGVINLRGAVVPVVDLAVKFGMEERPVMRTTCIVIVEGCFGEQNATMGVIADAVSQVIDLSASEIQEPPSFGTRIRVDYLLGVTQLGNKFALMLDVDKVLSTDELVSLNEAKESDVPEGLGIEANEVVAAIESVSAPSQEPEQHDVV
jgi:purine-binding chemotaxis protein CheW